MTRKKVQLELYLTWATVFLVLLLLGAGSVRLLAQNSNEKLNKKQLKELIANARTPEEHQRLASYYQKQAVRLTNESKQHADAATAFEGQPQGPAAKNPSMNGTVHCEKVAREKLQEAKEAEALAQKHENMAKAAESR